MTCFSTMARLHKTEPTEVEIARGKRFGQWLRGELARKGWNKTDLHEASGVSKTYIGVLANDCINNATGMYQRPSEEIIAKLANALGVSEDFAREASGWSTAKQSFYDFLEPGTVLNGAGKELKTVSDPIYTYIHDLVVGTEDHMRKIDERDPRIALIDASEGIPPDVAVPILNSYITAMNRIREGIGAAPVPVLPAGTASRPAATLPATGERPRETRAGKTLARTLEAYIPSGDFSGLTPEDLDQAMEAAFAEAEKMAEREFKNVFDNRFRQEAQMLLGKQGKKLSPLDRPLPPPAQKESVLDDIL